MRQHTRSEGVREVPDLTCGSKSLTVHVHGDCVLAGLNAQVLVAHVVSDPSVHPARVRLFGRVSGKAMPVDRVNKAFGRFAHADRAERRHGR